MAVRFIHRLSLEVLPVQGYVVRSPQTTSACLDGESQGPLQQGQRQRRDREPFNGSVEAHGPPGRNRQIPQHRGYPVGLRIFARGPFEIEGMQMHPKPIALPFAERAALRIPAAGQYLGIGTTSLYGLIKRGKIEVVKIGGRTLVIRASLDALLERAIQK